MTPNLRFYIKLNSYLLNIISPELAVISIISSLPHMYLEYNMLTTYKYI